jgi:IS6 family transposase
MAEQLPFKWRHFQSDIILLCVRWYLRYTLSYRDLEEMMLERGLCVDHTTIYRWVQEYAPELEKRCRPHLKPTTDSCPLVQEPAPRVINTDKNAAYPKAIADLKAAGVLPLHVELRQVKYLNNLIEQDHRFIKRLTKPGMGFFSFETAWRTLQGFEVMNMLRKGQLQGVKKGDVRGQVELIATLFGVAV